MLNQKLERFFLKTENGGNAKWVQFF